MVISGSHNPRLQARKKFAKVRAAATKSVQHNLGRQEESECKGHPFTSGTPLDGSEIPNPYAHTWGAAREATPICVDLMPLKNNSGYPDSIAMPPNSWPEAWSMPLCWGGGAASHSSVGIGDVGSRKWS